MAQQQKQTQKQTIIQLREGSEENTERQSAGHWTNNFNQPLKLNQGDTISVKQVYIDTSSQNTGLINIESDTDVNGKPTGTMAITFQFGYYVLDYYGSFPQPAGGNPVLNKTYADGDATKQNTGKPFVMMHGTIDAGQAQTPRELNSWTIPFEKEKQFGDDGNTCSFMIHYTDANGKKITGRMTMDTGYGNKQEFLDNMVQEGGKTRLKINGGFYQDTMIDDTDGLFIWPTANGQPNGQTVGIRISRTAEPAISGEGGKADGEGNVPKGDWPCADFDISDGVVDKSSNIYSQERTITIPAKKYQPAELASVISSEMEVFEVPTIAQASTANTLLLNTNQVAQDLGGEPTFMNLEMNQQFTFINQDAQGNALSYLIGSNQFGLIFDEATQKFQFSQLHIPRFTNDGSAKLDCFQNGAGERIIMNKYSGVFIHDIQPRDLFVVNPAVPPPTPNCMQFGQGLITALNQRPGVINGVNITASLPQQLTDGLNVTGGEASVDSIVFKSLDVNNRRHYDMAPNFNVVPFEDLVGQNITIHSIDTNDPEHLGQNGEGYYLVEIDFGISQDFQSTNIRNNRIQNIVSRYYVQSNYVTGSSDGSIYYTHKGEDPLMLSKFTCRILQPSGELATDIDNESAIFLQIETQK